LVFTIGPLCHSWCQEGQWWGQWCASL